MKIVLAILFLVSMQSVFASRSRCGRDYHQPLKSLIATFEKSYVKAGFKVISKNLESDSALLITRFTKKDSNYEYEYHHKFHVNSGEIINWCATMVASKEPSEYKAEERNRYLKVFEEVSAKASSMVAESTK